MPSLFINGSQLGSQAAYKLRQTSLVIPSVVFATNALGTKGMFISSLFERFTQVCTQLFSQTYAVILLFIHTVHSPNKDYYKGD